MSLCVFCVLLCLASGGVFFADYALFTDPSTGFAAMGSVWLRYAFLALLLFLIWFFSLSIRRRSRPERGYRSRVMTAAFGLQALSFFSSGLLLSVSGVSALLGGAALTDPVTGRLTFDIAGLVLSVLYLIAGLWCTACCGCFAKGRPQPVSGLALGIVATVSFFLLCVKRFVVSPTSIQRVMPTVDILTAMLAMLLCCALLRALYLPEDAREGRKLYFWGLAAFLFCFCLTGAKLLYLLTFDTVSVADAADLPVLTFGLLGGALAFRMVRVARRIPPQLK